MNNMKRLVPIFVTLILVITLGIIFLPKLIKESNKISGSSEFQVIGKIQDNIQVSYISVVYLDGYAYEPSEWLSYSHTGDIDRKNIIRGEKLGEVTLDLKGIKYIGIPPDFSSTYNVGTKIYEINDVKKERAILVQNGNLEQVFYRQRKAISSIDEPINQIVEDIFHMVSDSSKVVAIELRNEEDGSWMRTLEDLEILSLINKELPGLSIKSAKELGLDKYPGSYRVPVNLILEDGGAIHVQAVPDNKFASIFGGYIPISDELSKAFKELYDKGDEYIRINELIPYSREEVDYLYVADQIFGREGLCKEPKWSSGALYWILSYYQVEKTDENKDWKPVFFTSMGKSKGDSINIDFYEAFDYSIYLKISNNFYRIVKGQLKYEHLQEYLNNYTELGK